MVRFAQIFSIVSLVVSVACLLFVVWANGYTHGLADASAVYAETE